MRNFVFLAMLLAAAILVAAAGILNPLSSRSSAEAQGVVVDIGVQGPPFRWNPSNATVTTGTTVRWTVTGRAPHTVTSEGCFDARIGPCTFDSGADREEFLRADTDRASFEFTFDEPGVYPFYCRLHGAPGGGAQFGVIVVYEPGENPPAGSYFASQELLDEIAVNQAAAEGITPPSTGDGGLTGDPGVTQWRAAAVTLGLVIGISALGLLRERHRSS